MESDMDGWDEVERVQRENICPWWWKLLTLDTQKSNKGHGVKSFDLYSMVKAIRGIFFQFQLKTSDKDAQWTQRGMREIASAELLWWKTVELTANQTTSNLASLT